MSHSITLSREIQASPEAVYRAFRTPSGLLDWCAEAVELDTSKGQYLFLWADGRFVFLIWLREFDIDFFKILK